MGLRHLRELREYLKKNADKAFTRTTLRDELKQNYPTIQDNLAYLMDQEKVVEQIDGDPAKFQWKNT
jgi:predicted HTH transcriptional regulator